MTLSELIEQLQDMQTEHGDDVEVRLQTQRNYPLEATLYGATDSQQMDCEGPVIVYLCEGEQIGYGVSAAWEACR